MITLGMHRVNEVQVKSPERVLDLKNLTRLKASILKHGLLNPIIGTQINGIYIVTDGRHRLAVFQDLGWRQIPGYILEPDSFESIPKIQTTPGEQGRQVERLLKNNTFDELAELTKLNAERLQEMFDERDEA